MSDGKVFVVMTAEAGWRRPLFNAPSTGWASSLAGDTQSRLAWTGEGYTAKQSASIRRSCGTRVGAIATPPYSDSSVVLEKLFIMDSSCGSTG